MLIPERDPIIRMVIVKGVFVSVTFSFEIDEQNNLITVTCDHTTSSEDRSKVVDQLVDVLLERPTLNLMLDISEAESHMSDEERLAFGEKLAENKRYFQQNQTAFVTRKDRDRFSIILSSAYVNGFRRLVEFGNKREALQWLQGEFS